ncbi:MAG: hypothetical protein V3R76_00310 [Gammaproteobacteria bacterium]
MSLTRADIENLVGFLGNCQLTGNQAETLVTLKYKLVEMHKKLPGPKDATPTPTPPKDRGKRKKASK